MLSLILLGVIFAGCTKNNNIFSWAHKRSGTPASTEVLMADATSALSDGDYNKALELFEALLEKDPDNAEAIYGYAQALFKDAGVDLASLISSAFASASESESAPARKRSFSIKRSRTSSGESLIPEDIDINALLDAA